MVEGGSSDDQAIAFRATDQRCLMAMALVRRPGRCLERLAGDQLQGVERGGAEARPADANWQATQLALTKTAPAAVRNKIIEVP